MPCGRAWLCWDSEVSDRKPCPSDLSDERWALTEPVITAWKAAHPSVSGHQGGYAMREIVNAILYQGRTGCQWDYLPHDLPPRSAVSCYFARWRDDGTGQAIHDLLRWQAREKRGRLADPSLVVLDTQSVHAAGRGPGVHDGQGRGQTDARAQARPGCGCAGPGHGGGGAGGLGAREHRWDRPAGPVAAQAGTVRTALVDQGFKNAVAAHGATLGIEVKTVERNPADKGFVPQPKRWVVEQTYGILALHRRLVRDYEHRPASSESRVYWAR